MAIDDSQVSSLLDSLPAVFQEDRGQDPNTNQVLPNFVGRFLLAFEHLLLGLGDDPTQPTALLGLDEIIAQIQRYFEPAAFAPDGTFLPAESTPDEFLPWLASWLALVLREDWDLFPSTSGNRNRLLIAKASDLYKRRGTKLGLEQYLASFTVVPPTIDELSSFQLGVTSTVGTDTIVGEGAPFFFTVGVKTAARFTDLKRAVDVIQAIVDQQKPAHTYYTISLLEIPKFRVAVQSTVGVDTILG
jgi:phage tail-like protein